MANRSTKTQQPVYGSSISELACAKFINDYKDATYERGQAQLFCADFLSLFGISREEIISGEALEHRIKHYNQDKHKNEQCFIDAFIKNKIIIEMKSSNVKLDAAEEQIRKYYDDLPKNERPRLRMICDFKTIILRDMVADIRYKEFPVKELFNHAYKFNCLSDMETPVVHRDQEKLSIEASEKMASVYNAFKSIGFCGQDLMKMLVRLLFCMYAEDTDVFPQLSFTTLIGDTKEDGSDLRYVLTDLFNVLNTPESNRKFIKPEFEKFPYVNGGLFDDVGEIPPFDNCFFKSKLKTDKETGKLINPIRQAIYDCCWFDWHDISPAIFGAMFQNVMSSNERRQGGVHYTSMKNILKVIKPLFLDQLSNEWEVIEKTKNLNKYKNFQNKLAELKFLDPACGCGNFLMVAYQEVRRLENKVIKAITGLNKQLYLNISEVVCRVDIDQFYGIEILAFPCEVARVSMWLMKHMMNMELQKQMPDLNITPFLPLKGHANIHQGNALLLEWDTIFSQQCCFDYIFGNPPFVGARVKSGNEVDEHSQKKDIQFVFKGIKGSGDLDYASCWYQKATDYMVDHPKTHTALVATNSLTQGIHPYLLWKPICESGLQIEFAYKTFRWDNDAKGEAKVHCVIIGFNNDNQIKHTLFESDGTVKECKHINAYLMDQSDIWIKSRNTPLCNTPELLTGSQRIDNDLFKFSTEEKDAFIEKEPLSKNYFFRWYGADEFLYNQIRWVLYLGKCNPEVLKRMKFCMEIVKKVREYRLSSRRTQTLRAADRPNHFGLEVFPNTDFMIIPVVTSGNRQYIPFGFLSPNVMCSNQLNLIPGASLYHFGVLSSLVHMNWIKYVCGRLKSDYRYSKEIVYNNFPWPTIFDEQKQKIENTAQMILEARELFSECKIESLYNDILMPPELRKAHEANDKAVMDAYGFNHNMTEHEIVTELFKMYEKLVEAEETNKPVKKSLAKRKKQDNIIE